MVTPPSFLLCSVVDLVSPAGCIRVCSLFALAVRVSNVFGLSVFVGLKLEIIYFFFFLLVGVGYSSFIHVGTRIIH